MLASGLALRHAYVWEARPVHSGWHTCKTWWIIFNGGFIHIHLTSNYSQTLNFSYHYQTFHGDKIAVSLWLNPSWFLHREQSWTVFSSPFDVYSSLASLLPESEWLDQWAPELLDLHSLEVNYIWIIKDYLEKSWDSDILILWQCNSCIRCSAWHFSCSFILWFYFYFLKLYKESVMVVSFL